MNIKRFENNPFGENTYIIWNQATLEAALVDPGMSNRAEENVVDRFIADNKLIVKAILLTHIHIDHTFGVDYARERYGAKVYANRDDEYLGQRRQQQAQMFHLPVKISPLNIDVFVDEETPLSLGDEKIVPLKAPGHSAGSLLYYVPDSHFILTGDVLFQGSIGRTDLPGGDYATLIRSIHAKILELPPTTTIYPGHGPSTTIAEELRYNPYI